MKGLFIFLGILLCQQASAEQAKRVQPVELTWIIDHAPQKYFEEAAKVMAETLSKESKGTLSLKIKSIAAYSRIDKKKIRNQYIEMLNNNQTGIAQVYIDEFAQTDKTFDALNSPYLFRSHEHVEKIINGPIGKKILSRLESQGLKGLAFTYSGGYQNFLSGTKIDFFAPEPFKGLTAGAIGKSSLKALKLSEPSAEVTNTLFPYHNFIELVEMGKIDMSLLTFADSDEAFKEYRGKKQLYYYDSNFNVLFTIITMSKKTFDSLSPDQKIIMQNAAKKAADAERKMIIEDSKTTKMKLEKNEMTNPYITFIKMSDSEKVALRKIASATNKYFGKAELELIKEILNTK